MNRSTIQGFRRCLAWRLRPPTLALGGGGARGFAHIGVLESIENRGLPIRRIAGTSMGALVAAMYAELGSSSAVLGRWTEALDRGLIPEIKGPGKPHEVQDGLCHPFLQRARQLKDTLVVAFAIHRESVIDDDQLVRALDFLLPDKNIEDLPITLCFAATNLENGEEVDLCQGPLRATVKASASVPGVAPAVHIQGSRLVDGGVIAEVPVHLARRMGRPVLAVDVSMDLPGCREDETVLDTMMRTQLMTSNLLLSHQLREAQWVLRPSVGDLLWSEWDRMDEMAEIGRRAMDQWFEGVDEGEIG